MERNLNLNPWYNNNNNTPNSQWEYGNNLIPPLIPPLNNNSTLFPTYNNSPNNYASIPLNGLSPFQLYPNPLSYNLPPYNFPTIVNNNNNNNNNPIIDFPAINNGTINGAIDETESEMQEDSEEIDALLYSDSEEYNNDDDYDYDNNDNYMHENYELDSPVIRSNLLNGEEVASTSIIHPKKRRIGTDLDASIMDTASSAKCCKNNNNYNNNDGDDGLEFSDAESSCVGEERETIEEERENMSEKMEDYLEIKLKRKRIQETVGLLRRIIPGGKGKDAATILDEAISYLKSLKLKAKALGNNNH